MPASTNLSIYERYKRYSSYLAPIVADPLIRSYFAIVASVLLVSFFLVFALSPTINTILGLQKKIADQQVIVVALDKKITDLIQAQDVYSRISKNLPLIDQALPDKPNPQGIVADVVATAASSGVAIISLQFQPIPLSPDAPSKIPLSNGLPTVVFGASVAGTDNDIRRFVGNLETRLRYIRLSGFTVNYGAKSGVVTADITGLGYYIGYPK